MIKNLFALILLTFAIQATAASNAGTAVFQSKEGGANNTTRFEYLNESTSRMNVDEMKEFIRVDSLAFISIDGLYRASGETSRNNEQPQYCDACFTNEYPTSLSDHEDRGNVSKLSLLVEAKG